MGRLYEAPEGRAAEEIQGFLGVNLRKDRLSLADEELAKAINADLHRQPGAAVIRLARKTQFSTALSDTTIRRLAKVNAKRYQVAGQTLYRDQTSIYSSLSSTLQTTIVPFRPLNDSTTYAFICDKAGMVKDNGTASAATTWGIVAPTDAPRVGIGATGSLSGAYRAAYTYVRMDGTTVALESTVTANSSAVTLASNVLGIGDLAHPTDSQVTVIGVYRTVAGGSSPLLDSRETIPTVETTWGVMHPWEFGYTGATGLQFGAGIRVDADRRSTQTWESDTTTLTAGEDAAGIHSSSLWEIVRAYVTTQTKRWGYASTIADASLGAAAPSDNGTPPRAAWGCEFQGHILLADTAAVINRHRVYWSNRHQPEIFDADDFLEVGNPDDPILCIHPLAGLAGIFTRLTKYRMTGNATSGFVAQEALSRRGTPCRYASKATEFGVLFLARDGVFRTNLFERDAELSAKIAPIFYGEDVNGISRINWDAIDTACLETYKGRLYLSLPTGTSTTPNLMAVYSGDTEQWFFFQYASASPRSMFVEEDVDDLVAGFTDGLVYVLEDADAEESVALEVETKDYFGQTTSSRKLFLWAKVDAEIPTGATLTVKVYIDGALKLTTTMSAGSRAKPLLPLPASLGYSWRVNVTYTGTADVRVYGVECLWAPMAAA